MICVAVKRNLRVFTWNVGGRVQFAREHVVDADILSGLWVDRNLCVGLATGRYMFLDPLSGIVVADVPEVGFSAEDPGWTPDKGAARTHRIAWHLCIESCRPLAAYAFAITKACLAMYRYHLRADC